MTGITQSTALWYASRATGVVSLILLTLVVVLGMLVNRQGRLPRLPAFAVTGLHRNISLLSVAFVAVHVATAIADPYVTIRLVSAVIPFTSGYQPFWLGMGAISVDLIAALIVTSLLRSRLPRRIWRGVHWLAYAAWPVAFAHSLGSSPDLRSGGLLEAAIACAVGVGAALLWRVTHAMRDVPRAERAAVILSSARNPAALPPGHHAPSGHPHANLADAHLTRSGSR
jgi:sulfoxide reductase heme-binding subunit YedZ